MEKKIFVPDMRCEHCVARIQKALEEAKIPGTIDLATKTVSVAEEQAKAAYEEIYDLGFSPEMQ